MHLYYSHLLAVTLYIEIADVSNEKLFIYNLIGNKQKYVLFNWMIGSLAGAAASQKVTEVLNAC